ncbi:gamma subclass chorismate mutase AroQ [Streptomyces atratus]|uniref:gamma subclass chorismate mutase AroQ n=1 Tax=Streptomyces atratus TaxID=1893 RepID=UPI002B1DC878|nr:gamma subclass chorismate mutase AroQ [Streptomyces atratus]
MQQTSKSVHLLTTAVAATALFTGATTAAPASVAATHTISAAESGDGPHSPLFSITDLSAQRIVTGDLVAAAKWGADSPIDDPAREQQVLDAVAEQARNLGGDSEVTRRIFRDQIEANKEVQRGLHRLWQDDPSKAPAVRPGLSEVRKEVNRINQALVRAVAVSALHRSAPLCGGALVASAVRVRHERHLDELHTAALAGSLKSVCGSRVRCPSRLGFEAVDLLEERLGGRRLSTSVFGMVPHPARFPGIPSQECPASRGQERIQNG